MAITMLDVAVTEQKPLKKAIIMAMFKGQLPSPMDAIPLENANALSQQIVRLTDIGSPSTRNIGDSVTAYQAKFTNTTETLKVIENTITIDKVLLEVSTYIQDPISLQTKAYAEGVKFLTNDLLINGNPSTDVTQPSGLQYRLNNDALFINQCVNAAALDVDANDANRNTWLDYIDTAITLVRGQADMVAVNRQTWIKFRSALRNLKVLDTTKDQFDRVISTYGGTKIYDAGVKPAGVVTGASAQQVIADDTGTSIFGTANTTPMFFINTSQEDGVRILQLHALKVNKIGINPNNPANYVVDVTWPIGFLTPQKFCLTSVQGLDVS